MGRRPDNIVKVDNARLYSALWGDARRNPPAAMNVWIRLKLASLQIPMSPNERRRLEWFIAYNTKFRGNARKTCRYFGISPKTFYYWKKRFEITNPRCLRTLSRRPKNSPRRIFNQQLTGRIYDLRVQHPYYSKMKIAVLYEKLYRQKVSSWQVQKVIEDYLLYPDRKRARKLAWRRKNAPKKRRIWHCPIKPWTGWLFSLDSITLYLAGEKRYILTAIDRHSRLLFTRAYKSHSSAAAADFLEQLIDFADNRVQNIHTDNGSEFHACFEQAAKRLQLMHWWSRTRTPKDNAMNERVNRTVQEEFLPAYRHCTDLEQFNQGLVAWMTDYNWERPHQSLDYKTPMEVAMASPNPMPRYYDWLRE